MSYEELPNPWPMLLVAVFDDDQEEEAGKLGSTPKDNPRAMTR